MESENEIILAEPGSPALALEIPKRTSFEEWVALGKRLAASEQVLGWYIGDWWAFGDHKYGARAAAVAQGIFRFTYGTLAVYGSVCRAFEPLRRLKDVPFGHHQVVASLPPEEADQLLVKAEQDQLTNRELRRELIRHKIAAGHIQFQREEDAEQDQTVAIARAWNRACYPARRTILDMLEEAGAISVEREDAEREELDP